MDSVVRFYVSGRFGKGIPALLLLPLLMVPSGCHWGGRGATSPPPEREERAADNAATAEAPEWLPPAVVTEEAKGLSPSDNTAIGAEMAPAPSAGPRPEAKAGSGASAPQDNAARSAPPPSTATASGAPTRADASDSARRLKPAAASHPVPTAPAKETREATVPGWAKSPEELSYRVDFIGITMGYARFRYRGKVLIAGKPAYHLNVRAWTSGVLSFIYPINDTIDYYLDTETLAPIRQEFTHTEKEREKDDVALYNQETGRITYRYRQSGKIRKQVDTVPSVYDPVSLAYYFRWKDLGIENRPRNMYGGRKVYQISSRVLGRERIRTEHGEMDTIAVLPVIRRNGKPDPKGDLKIWFSNDERRVPVRVYAKFHKIKDWTLVGELMPPSEKAGG
ncbi:MAG TPA: DUF3108 domain-containing protein [Candidatus Deferrimicrobium sp.]|nr:DUF3108 domain-containing protein [Candidatus Deferrimicrobium sp.]